MMIHSFADKSTEAIWNGTFAKKLPPQIQAVARRKLRMLSAAMNIEDLRIPPANHLEKLGGDRNGQWSIRINSQWRICFAWRENGAHQVEICDYH